MRPGGRMYGLRRPHTGGGGGRAEILKAAKRVARMHGGGGGGGGFMQDQLSSNTTNNATSLSKHALTVTSNADTPLFTSTTLLHGDNSSGGNINVFDTPWEFVDNYFDHDDSYDDDVCDQVYYDDKVFGRVPSADEVDSAILSLQRIIDRPASPSTSTTGEMTNLDKDVAVVMEVTSSKGSTNTLDWVEPSMQICDQRSSGSSGLDRVYDAVRLLQTEPKVLRMVKSVSTDGAVWNAIMNNETVREIRDSFLNETSNSSNANSNVSKSNPNILKWMFDNMKAKLVEVIGIISQFLGEILQPLELDSEQNSDMFIQKINTMFMLSVVVLLIVVVTRAHNG